MDSFFLFFFFFLEFNNHTIVQKPHICSVTVDLNTVIVFSQILSHEFNNHTNSSKIAHKFIDSRPHLPDSYKGRGLGFRGQ